MKYAKLIKSLIFYDCLFCAAIVITFVLSACSPQESNKKTILHSPSGIAIEDDVLTWNAVKNAEEYAVYVDDAEYVTAETSFDLFEITSNPGVYNVKVRAFGDLKTTLDSDDSANIEYTVEKDKVMYICKANDDGETCTLRANSLSDPQGKVIVPSTVNGLRVTKLYKESFAGFDKMTKIYLPDGITEIETRSFYNCTALKRIRMPDTLITLRTKALENCTSLESLHIPAGVDYFSANTVSNCYSLKKLTVDENNEFYKSDRNCIIQRSDDSVYLGCSESVIPEYSATLKQFSFNSSGLTEITVPDNITVIENGTFYNCVGLTHAVLPADLTEIEERVFSGCSSLVSITIPDSITTIKTGAFDGCSALAYFTVSSDVNVIEQYAFSSCSALDELKIPKKVRTIEKFAFSGCSSITKLQIPASVDKIESNALNKCDGIAEISVDPKNAVYKSDGNCLIETDINTVIFGNKTSVIPDYVTAIGKSAFSHSDVSIVIIPDGVKTIESFAFSACKNLTSVYLPDSIEYIERNAFTECNKLQGVTLHPGIKKIDNESFGIDYGVHDFSSNGTAAYIPFNFKDKNDLPYGGCASLGGNVPVFTDCSIGYDGVYAYVKSFVYEYKRLSNSSSYIVKDCSIDCLVAERSPVEPSYYTKFEYAANLRAPVRMGYTFAGWATEPSGAVVYASYLNAKGILCTLSYDERQTIPSGTALYAVWTKATE